MWDLGVAAFLGLASTFGVAQTVDTLTRSDGIPVSSLLIFRGLLGILLLLIWIRPGFGDLRPKQPRLSAMRLVSGGLTYLGWFGAIAYLSAPVTTALLLLDAVLLGLIKSLRANTRASIAECVLFVALASYVAVVWATTPATFTHVLRGVALVTLAIVARAASGYIWQRSTETGESTFYRIAAPLAGGILAGLGSGRGVPIVPGLLPVCLIFGTAFLALLGYVTSDFLIGRLGAFRARLIDILAVPLLGIIAIFQGSQSWSEPVVATLVVVSIATGWVLATTSREPKITALSPGPDPSPAPDRR